MSNDYIFKLPGKEYHSVPRLIENGYKTINVIHVSTYGRNMAWINTWRAYAEKNGAVLNEVDYGRPGIKDGVATMTIGFSTSSVSSGKCVNDKDDNKSNSK